MDSLQLFKDLIWNDKMKPFFNLILIVSNIYLTAEAYGSIFINALPMNNAHKWYVIEGFNLLEILVSFGFVIFCQGVVIGIVSLIHWIVIQWINKDVRRFCQEYGVNPKQPLSEQSILGVKRKVRPMIFKIANYCLNDEQRLQDLFNEIYSIEGYQLNSRFCIVLLSMLLTIYLMVGGNGVILIFLIMTSLYFIISGFLIKGILNFKGLIIKLYAIDEHYSNKREISN